MKKLHHPEEFKMSEESMDTYFRSIKARNYPLEGLDRPVFCGVVLHDEAKPSILAEGDLRKQGLKVEEADSTKRFRGRTVDLHGDHEWKQCTSPGNGNGIDERLPRDVGTRSFIEREDRPAIPPRSQNWNLQRPLPG